MTNGLFFSEGKYARLMREATMTLMQVWALWIRNVSFSIIWKIDVQSLQDIYRPNWKHFEIIEEYTRAQAK